MAAGCASVIVCRASPSQKAAVVRMMMEYEVIPHPVPSMRHSATAVSELRDRITPRSCASTLQSARGQLQLPAASARQALRIVHSCSAPKPHELSKPGFWQVDTAQAGKRGKFARWLARYKRRMDFKMLAIGDGGQPLS